MAKKDEKWMQKAVPEKNEGKFTEYCKQKGNKGVTQKCIDEAIESGGKRAQEANFAINVSDKYKHPEKKRAHEEKTIVKTAQENDFSREEIFNMVKTRLEELMQLYHIDKNLNTNLAEIISLCRNIGHIGQSLL
jgi:hypothetical protein